MGINLFHLLRKRLIVSVIHNPQPAMSDFPRTKQCRIWSTPFCKKKFACDKKNIAPIYSALF